MAFPDTALAWEVECSALSLTSGGRNPGLHSASINIYRGETPVTAGQGWNFQLCRWPPLALLKMGLWTRYHWVMVVKVFTLHYASSDTIPSVEGMGSLIISGLSGSLGFLMWSILVSKGKGDPVTAQQGSKPPVLLATTLAESYGVSLYLA